MGRLVVLWTRPYHLSVEEADAWARREAAGLLALAGVARAELTRLDTAATRHAAEWDWMLELHLREGVDRHACAEQPAFVDWLLDLRLLGMRPTVVVVDDTTTLAPKVR
jgi:hypothetical protein